MKKGLELQVSYREQLRADFSNASQTYDAFAQVQQQNYEALIQFAQSLNEIPSLIQGSLALDVGSGPGEGLGLIKETLPGFDWVALDMSDKMLGQHVHALYKLAADMNYLPLRSNSLDLVLSNFAFHWSENLSLTISEVYRVLKPQRCCILSFPVQGSFQLLEDIWQEVGLSSPLHQMPDLADVLSLLRQQEYLYQYRTRHIPLSFETPKACFNWLKQTGVRQKGPAKKNMTKQEYLGIVSTLAEQFSQQKKLSFEMVDLVLVKP